ncbi:MAG TPA: amidohydrolase family protein [Candidatus Methylomirabilis sp.]|nr:amidohydrolase family protein [Candidatus Methylomirabilis sp.]
MRTRGLSWLLAVVLALPSFASGADITALRGARIIDGTGRKPIENGVIVLEGSRIKAIGPAGEVKVPKNARAIDVSNRTIMPGILSAHSHVGLVAKGKNRDDAYVRDNVLTALDQFEQYGVTGIVSLGLNRDLIYDVRAEQRAGKLGGATVYVGDRGLGVMKGAPPLPHADDQLYQPKDPNEARQLVRAAAARKPDILKIWVDDLFGSSPKMDRAIYRAIIEEAHRQHLKVAAHVFYLEDAKRLVSDGIDVLAHSVRDQHVDGELISMMKAKKTFYVATLAVEESFFGFADHPDWVQERFLAEALTPEQKADLTDAGYKGKVEANPAVAIERKAMDNVLYNVKALRDAGVDIALGTDSGGNPYRIQGWAEHRELQLMVKAGLTPMQAIMAGTKGSARLIGAKDRGTLEKGKRADLLVLAANPLDDIANTQKLVSIWHDGREIAPRVPASGKTALR